MNKVVFAMATLALVAAPPHALAQDRGFSINGGLVGTAQFSFRSSISNVLTTVNVVAATNVTGLTFTSPDPVALISIERFDPVAESDLERSVGPVFQLVCQGVAQSETIQAPFQIATTTVIAGGKKLTFKGASLSAGIDVCDSQTLTTRRVNVSFFWQINGNGPKNDVSVLEFLFLPTTLVGGSTDNVTFTGFFDGVDLVNAPGFTVSANLVSGASGSIFIAGRAL